MRIEVNGLIWEPADVLVMNHQELKINLEFDAASGDNEGTEEDLFRECQSLRNLINSNVGTATVIQGGETQPGEKGDPLMIGQILVEAIAAPVTAALLDCVRVWLESRKKEFTLRFEKDGRIVEFQSTNLSESKIQGVLSELGELLAN